MNLSLLEPVRRSRRALGFVMGWPGGELFPGLQHEEKDGYAANFVTGETSKPQGKFEYSEFTDTRHLETL